MKRSSIPTGPKGHFLFGSIKDYKEDVLNFFLKISEEHGDLVSFNLGPKKIYLTKKVTRFSYLMDGHFHQVPH